MKTKDNEFMMAKITLGMQIYNMLCKELGEPSRYKDKILIPSYRFVVDHCKKSLAQLIEEGHDTSLKDTYDNICKDISSLPQGKELMDNVLTYGHFKLMVRYMVYCHRELADSEATKEFEKTLVDIEQHLEKGQA